MAKDVVQMLGSSSLTRRRCLLLLWTTSERNKTLRLQVFLFPPSSRLFGLAWPGPRPRRSGGSAACSHAFKGAGLGTELLEPSPLRAPCHPLPSLASASRMNNQHLELLVSSILLTPTAPYSEVGANHQLSHMTLVEKMTSRGRLVLL